MKNFVTTLLASAALCVSGSAFADDSSAVLDMGGVQFAHSTDIRMSNEDLRISAKEVRIRFEFTNDSGKDIDTMVAFPLPDLDTSEFTESPLGTTTTDPLNFVGFEVTADGVKVPVQVEQRAMYKGKDVTALVKSVGLPVNVVIGNSYDRLKALTPAQKKLLESHDLTDNSSGDDEHPHWTVVTKYYWNEKFPAGKTVVLEQRYEPVTGQSFFSETELNGGDEDARFYTKNFCIDAPTKAAIQKQMDISKKMNKEDGALLLAFTTDYVLSTGNNWKGPIGHFHLTLDKGKPDDVLTTCWNDGSLKKTGPTTFEATIDNYAPKHDVHMLVVEQRPAGQ